MPETLTGAVNENLGVARVVTVTAICTGTVPWIQ